MPRLTISLPDNLHSRIAAFALRENDSMSSVINALIQVGLQQWQIKQNQSSSIIEQHCQQLIIQMNALVKSISVELLKFDEEDFVRLQLAAAEKLNEISQNSN